MGITAVKEKRNKVKRRKSEHQWDKAISAIDIKVAVTAERLQNLREIRERFVALRSEGEPWPESAAAKK